MTSSDWDQLLGVYRAARAGGNADRMLRRWLKDHDVPLKELGAVRAELERRLRAETVATLPPSPPAPRDIDAPPPEPAPLFPPPPAPEPPKLAPATSTPAPAPLRQESPVSVDLSATISRALPLALSLYSVAHDSGAIDEIAEAVKGTARRAANLRRRGPLADADRDKLCREAREEIRCVLPQISEDALESVGEIVIDAIDERTNTGPLEEVDGPAAKRGLAALLERIDLWGTDPGNLEARAKRARRQAEAAIQEAERLERLAARKRGKG